jgi:hypothetical protein
VSGKLPTADPDVKRTKTKSGGPRDVTRVVNETIGRFVIQAENASSVATANLDAFGSRFDERISLWPTISSKHIRCSLLLRDTAFLL